MAKQFSVNKQGGFSLGGLIVVMAVLGVLAVFGMKVFPTYLEYRAIKNGIENAKRTGGSPQEMRLGFAKAADINSIESISGKDLMITKDNGETDVSFQYEKRIPLAGNVSLVIDYSGTTAKDGVVPEKTPPAQ